jgi:cardiolipin synthase (CMP-forming)
VASAALSLPNLLSGFRLLAAPVLIALAFAEMRGAFAVLLTFALLSDALDGLIARRWNLVSEFGARLDSLADNATYAAAFLGMFAFEAEALAPYWPELAVFIAFLVLSTVAPLLKFGRPGSYHLLLFKCAAVVQALAVLALFYFGLNAALLYLAIGIGILACIEDIAATLLLIAPRSNLGSVFVLLGRVSEHPGRE